MIRPLILKFIKKIAPLKALYLKVNNFRMRKKILNFTKSNARYFTVSSNSLHEEVAILADYYGSDKDSKSNKSNAYVWPPHTYGFIYELLFFNRRNTVLNVFECGIGSSNPTVTSNMGLNGKSGASLRLWRDYFPNAEIYGADIDKDVLFSEERIKTYELDQTNANSISKLWKKIPDVKFDLMVDDGLHNVKAGMTLLINSIAKLNLGGIYIIEDVSVNDLSQFDLQLTKLGIRYSFITAWRLAEFGYDNNLILIYPK